MTANDLKTPAEAVRTPTVSVGIPVYNGAQHIGEAIESLLNQTYPHWILRVHNNVSTDNTRQAVESFRDPRVELVDHDEHLPMAENWQRCLPDAARGEFFQLLCADDVLHPSCFEEKMREAVKPENKNAVLFTSNRMLTTAKGKPLFAVGYGKRAQTATLREVLRGVAATSNPIGDPGTVMIRSAALQKETRPFSGQLTVDIDFWLRLLEHGDLRHIPRTLSSFRLSGMTGREWFRDLRDYFRFYRTAVRGRLTNSPWWYYAGYARAPARFVLRQLVYAFAR